MNELVLADLKLDGSQVPVLMKADRNGFFYVLNRQTGELLSAEKFVPVNWAQRIDLQTGLPVEIPESRPTADYRVQSVYPSFLGGKNWEPMAYNPTRAWFTSRPTTWRWSWERVKSYTSAGSSTWGRSGRSAPALETVLPS